MVVPVAVAFQIESTDTQEYQTMTSSPTVSTRLDPFPVQDPYYGIYAHGVETRADARTQRISGQVGVAPDGRLSADFAGQCRQALANVEAVLQAA